MSDFSNNINTANNSPSVFSKVQTMQLKKQDAVPAQTIKPEIKAESDTVDLKGKLRKAKRKNGIIEKVYDSIKNITGLGVSSKKIESAINENKDSKEIENMISNYRVSQEKSSQSVADVLSIGAAGATFFKLKNMKTNLKTIFNINADTVKEVLQSTTKSGKTFDKLKKIANSDKKNALLFAAGAALVGGLTKYWTLKINRIRSKRYVPDKQDNSLTVKQQKKLLKSERKNANFRNFATGALNGLLMPIMTLGGIIGAPIYLAANSVSRYFFGEKNDEDKKSLKGFKDSIIKNPITTIAAAALVAIPLVKKGNFSKVLTQNSETVMKNLQKAKLQEFDATKSVYSQLEDILFGEKSIKSILTSYASVDDKIKDLTKENIFAVKFKQIQKSGGLLGGGDELSTALKDACPPSRTMDQAQKLVEKTFGKQYKLTKTLGVGTVAETYLAKGEDGKEVCIKLLKDGISANKIKADKEKFIEIIKKQFANQPDKKDEMNYLIKNVESLAEGISKEVDFNHEMKAAQKLARHTHVANVVNPITVKNNIYIMEKAEGIGLQDLTRLNELHTRRKILKPMVDKNPAFASFMKSELDSVEKEIAAITARTPKFGNIELSKADADYMLEEYMKVLVEQFNKVEKSGKTIHGDIHPGNVFINVDAIRNRSGKAFTLIDTGNTVDQSMEQALRAINLTKYLKDADVENLAKYALDGDIKLPKGLTKEQALEKMQKELKEIFFNNKTAIGQMDNDEFTKISNSIMKKLNIIPSDAQGNLFKAKQSANESFENLSQIFYENILADATEQLQTNPKSKSNAMKTGVSVMKDIIQNRRKFKAMKTRQEKMNLCLLTPKERVQFRKSKSTPARNSVEYLTFKYKQLKKEDLDTMAENMVKGMMGGV